MTNLPVPLRNLTFCLILLAAPNAFAPVGYINVNIYPGDNLIANQLDNNGHNDLNAILSFATPGAAFTKWDSVANQYLPASVFDGTSWSINYNLNFGEGGLLRASSPWTNTFVGSVYPASWLGIGTNVWQP